jgi:uncharacterized protein involved in exopolysaccharide biosynthesis
MSDKQPPSSAQNPDPNREDGEIDLLAIWRVLVDRKKRIAQISAGITVLAVIYALILPPVYRAEVLIMPLTQEPAGAGPLSSQFSDLATLAGISLSGNADAQTQRALATLKSRALTESFMKEAGVLPVMFSSMWDEKTKAWKDTSWFGSDEKPTGPSMENAYRMFSGIRTVQFDRKTNLTTVTIDWEDPKLAAQWANQLVKHVNARLQGEAVKDAERNIDYLRKQLSTNSAVEIQQAIFNLIEAQMKAIMVASTREEYAFKVIDPATVPERKLKPSRRLIVLVGLFLGLLAGIATVLLQPRVQPHLQPYIDTLRERWRKWRKIKTA